MAADLGRGPGGAEALALSTEGAAVLTGAADESAAAARVAAELEVSARLAR